MWSYLSYIGLPGFIDQFGKSDAWAYAVVGERYGDNDESNLTLVGWTSQAVCYEKDSPWFTGVDRAGADVAERDALIWAGLWRLSINSDIPTVFCFDSATAGYFASGLFGSPQPSSQHRLLRGIFQAIEALVGQEHLGMHHVHGHCGLLWNELVDAAARYNASTVCFSPRQGLNIQKWRTVLYHLWMIFGGPSIHLPCKTEVSMLAPQNYQTPPVTYPSAFLQGNPRRQTPKERCESALPRRMSAHWVRARPATKVKSTSSRPSSTP